MQMKKSYLLLFLIALLFGTATMRGAGSLNTEVVYYFKLGGQYMKMPKKGTYICVPDKSNAGFMKFGLTSSGIQIIGFEGSTDVPGAAIRYLNRRIGKLGKDSFEYVEQGGKHYLKSTQEKVPTQNGYLTNKNGKISIESDISEGAVFEFENANGANPAEVAEKAKAMLNKLSFFQAYRYELGDRHEASSFIGSELGQYPHPVLPDNNHAIKDKWEYFSYKMYRKDFPGLDGDQQTATAINVMEACEAALHINMPKTGTYVVISTKSPYEEKIRLNDHRSNELNFTPGSAAGQSQPAQYLKATANGYQLTATKDEAAVFFFDGHHLTGLDNGFGLNNTQYKYDLTADAQAAVVAQGKLVKTLDAGSYSLKVGDKFVKLDNTGLNMTTDEAESHIFLEEVTKFKLNTNELGYVSFFAPTAVKVPDNVQVYTGKLNAGNTQLTFTEVNNKQIPENTAVLLQMGTSQTQFEVEKIATASDIPNNSLKGYAVSSADHKNNAYGLMAENGKLVFKRLSDGVHAFRAVVYQNNGAGTQEFIPTSFAPTGIQGVTAEEKQEEVFDLAGRRVEFPVKGQVYVKGGKKFIQK